MTSFQEKLSAIEIKRASAGPLPPGAAPCITGELFKVQESGSKPRAKSWNNRLTSEAHCRGGNTLKANAFIDPSTVISLGTARPAPEYLPWQSVHLASQQPILDVVEATNPHTTAICTKGEASYDLAIAMNYGYSAGSPQVLRFVTEHVEMFHNPKYADWDCCLTCGTTSALEFVFRMLCNPGDFVLTEDHTYAGTTEANKALGLSAIGVKMDALGLMPDELDKILSGWDATKGKKPFVLYTIPCGQNPTGATQSAERRREIYAVAEQHDLLIVEDDPYQFLSLSGSLASRDEYLKDLLPSYLSLDRTGRVLRLDTTSKFLAPGLRLGWLSGPVGLVEKFCAHTELSVVAPSGPSQLMVYKLLEESWGHDGFLDWLQHLSLQYKQRRDIVTNACKRHLPLDICSWDLPTVGMFLWINVDTTKHPNKPRALDLEERIYLKSRGNGVLVSRGSWFAIDKGAVSRTNFRLTFAAAPQTDLETAVERFARAVRTEFAEP